jgi:hypothetical protein
MNAAALGSRLDVGTQFLKKLVRFARGADTLRLGPASGRHDEIGRLARAVQNFRDAVARILELEDLEPLARK